MSGFLLLLFLIRKAKLYGHHSSEKHRKHVKLPYDLVMGCMKDGYAVGYLKSSVLHPVLFSLFTNDIDEGIKGRLSTFSDNTRGGGEREIVIISQNRLKVQRRGVLFSKILFRDANCEVLILVPWLGSGCEVVLENHKLSTR